MGIALMHPDSYDANVPERESAQVVGEWNRISGPDAEDGNIGGALCPGPSSGLWPPGFLREWFSRSFAASAGGGVVRSHQRRSCARGGRS